MATSKTRCSWGKGLAVLLIAMGTIAGTALAVCPTTFPSYQHFALFFSFATHRTFGGVPLFDINGNPIVDYLGGAGPLEDFDGDGLQNFREFDGWTSTINCTNISFTFNSSVEIADPASGCGSLIEEPDSDGDGLSDRGESALFGAITNPRNVDTDGDGMEDEWEAYVGLDARDGGFCTNTPAVLNQAPTADPDGDGLTSIEEMAGKGGGGPYGDTGNKRPATAGIISTAPAFDANDVTATHFLGHYTKPLDFDSDRDRLVDSFEYYPADLGFNHDPQDLADDADADPDRDGLTTYREQCVHPLLGEWWAPGAITRTAIGSRVTSVAAPWVTTTARIRASGWLNLANVDNTLNVWPNNVGTVQWGHPTAIQRWSAPNGVEPIGIGYDTDGDLIPDGWEIEHGLNPLSGIISLAGSIHPSGGLGDPDADTLLNFEEYFGQDGYRIDLITGTGDESNPWITRAVNRRFETEFMKFIRGGSTNLQVIWAEAAHRAVQAPQIYWGVYGTSFTNNFTAEAFPGFFEPISYMSGTNIPLPGVPPPVSINDRIDGTSSNFNPFAVANGDFLFVDRNSNGVYNAGVDDLFYDTILDGAYTVGDLIITNYTSLVGGEFAMSIVSNAPVRWPMPGYDTDDDGQPDNFEIRADVALGKDPTAPTLGSSPYTPRSAFITGSNGISVSSADVGEAGRRMFNQDWTLETWVYLKPPIGTNTYHGSFVRGEVVVGPTFRRVAYELGISNSLPYVGFQTLGGQGYRASSMKSLSMGRWVHLAGVFDHAVNGLSLYIDGTLDQARQTLESATAAYFGSALYGNGGRVTMAVERGGSARFQNNLWLDEVRIWGVPRTVDEIGNNFKRLVDPFQYIPSPPYTTIMATNENAMFAYYTFDDGGITAEDVSKRACVSLLGYLFPQDPLVPSAPELEYLYRDWAYSIDSDKVDGPGRAFTFDANNVAPIIGVVDGERGAYDSDEDTLPDAWELIHEMNAFKDMSPDHIQEFKYDPDWQTAEGPTNDPIRDMEFPKPDGIDNITEYFARTNPRKTDTDEDAIPDRAEDFDKDGLPLSTEFNIGSRPDLADTDDDGFGDSFEQGAKTSPVRSLDPPRSRAIFLDGYVGSYLDIPQRAAMRMEDWTMEARVLPSQLTHLADGQGTYILRRATEDANNHMLAANYELRVVRRGTNYTVEARFVYIDADTGNGKIVRAIGNPASNQLAAIGLDLDDNDPSPNGNFTHVASSFDSTTRTLRAYVNGREVARAIAPEEENSSSPVSGDGPDTFIHLGEGFRGFIQEARLWSTNRTSTEVQSNMNSPLNGNESGLTSYFSMDDGGWPAFNFLAAVLGTVSNPSSLVTNNGARYIVVAPATGEFATNVGNIVEGVFQSNVVSRWAYQVPSDGDRVFNQGAAMLLQYVAASNAWFEVLVSDQAILRSVRYSSDPGPTNRLEGDTWWDGANIHTFESTNDFTTAPTGPVFIEQTVAVVNGSAEEGDFAEFPSRDEYVRRDSTNSPMATPGWKRWGPNVNWLADARWIVESIVATTTDLPGFALVGDVYFVSNSAAFYTFNGFTYNYDTLVDRDRFLVRDTGQVLDWDAPASNLVFIADATTDGGRNFLFLRGGGYALRSDGTSPTAWRRWGFIPTTEDFTTTREWTEQWDQAARRYGGVSFRQFGAIDVGELPGGGGGGGTPGGGGTDSDGDGLPDDWEIDHGLDPNDASGDNGASGDPDGDGLDNLNEFWTNNDPQHPDTDDDGIHDGAEDFDGDHLTNRSEQDIATMPFLKDTDDDGVSDHEEVTGTFDPGFIRSFGSSPPTGTSDPLLSLDPPIARSMRFDGFGRVAVPPQDKIMLTNWTIAVWVKPDAGSDGGVVISRFVDDISRGGSGINYQMGVEPDGAMMRPFVRYLTKDGIEVRLDGTGVSDVLVGGCDALIPPGAWSHLTSTYNRQAHRLELYIDGLLATYTLAATPLPPTVFDAVDTHKDDEVTVGAARSIGPITEGFEGYIDEIKAYDYVLTADDILAHFNAPPAFGGGSGFYTLKLKSGWYQPAPGISASLSSKPANVPVHAIVQFSDGLDPSEVEAIQQSGIPVLNRVSSQAVTVFATRSQISAMTGMRWAGLVEPQWKISPRVSKSASAAPNSVLIQFYPGTSESAAVGLVQALGGDVFEDRFIGGSYLVAEANPSEVQAIAADDRTLYITPAAAALTSGGNAHLMDESEDGNQAAPFTTLSEGWDGPGQGSADLTYFFVNSITNIPGFLENDAVVDQMDKWAEHAAITWTESVFDLERSVDIFWSPIDGANGILAFAFLPADVNSETLAGDIFFDAEEDWHLDADIDVNWVALHELGHSLGLGHSDDPDSVMYPFYISGRPAVLGADDIAAIQSIYAKPDLPVLSLRFDDCGFTAEDFTESKDWLVDYFHASELIGDARFSTNAPLLDADTDLDGMPDWWETAHGFKPLDSSNADEDPDGDGLSNKNEYRAGTNPNTRDTDLDGIYDSLEDSDGDTLLNAREIDLYNSDPGQADTDDDFLRDDVEVEQETDPSSSVSPYVVRALHFGATGGVGRVTVPDRVLGQFTDQFALTQWTLECYVRPSSIVGGDVSLIRRQADCNGFSTFHMGLRNGRPFIALEDNGGTRVERIAAAALDPNAWTHLAGRLSGGMLTLFIDGVPLAASNTSIVPTLEHGDVVFGGDGFLGDLKEIRIWQVGRRDEDILKFIDRTLFFDSSATDPGLARFAGNGSLRESATTVSPLTGFFIDQLQTWTLEGWVKTTSSGVLISRWATSIDPNNDTDFNFVLRITDEGKLQGGFSIEYDHADQTVNDDGSITETLTHIINHDINNIFGAFPVNDGQWHHVAYTRTDAATALYVDGDLDATSSGLLVNAADLPVINVSIRSFGYGGPVVIGNFLSGDMDEIRIWNRGLSLEEIRDYGYQNLEGDEPNLITYFNFDYQLTTKADERAALRNPLEEFGRFIPNATHVRGDDGPPITIYPLRVYAGIALDGYFTADDGGATLENYMHALDWDYAGVLAGDVAFTNLPSSEQPFDNDSDNDGLPDWWETQYGLSPGSDQDPENAWGDPDRDGLHNRAEYDVWSSNNIPLDPMNPDSLETGLHDFFDWDTNNLAGHDFRIFGEQYTDFDGVEDSWEVEQGLNPRAYDSHFDSDGDGWSNLSEYFDSTDPYDVQSYPVPTVNVYVTYEGFRTQGPIVLNAYHSASMDGIPDATCILGEAQEVANSLILTTTAAGSTLGGTLDLIPVVPGTVRIFIGTLTFQDLGNGVLRTTSSSPVRFGQIDYETGAWTVSTLPSSFPAGTSVRATWSFFTGIQSFPFSGTLAVINGHLREGDNWMFAFIDQAVGEGDTVGVGDGTWKEGEPAGIAHGMPINVRRGEVEPVFIELTESQPQYGQPDYELPGYGRFSWPEKPSANSYRIRIINLSENGGPLVIDRIVQAPRTYFHEQDYRLAGKTGMPQAGYQWFAYHSQNNVDSVITNGLFVVTYPALANPVPITPEGSVLIFGRNKLQWSSSVGATAFQLQVSRTSAFSAPHVVNTTFVASPPDGNGNVGEYIPLPAGDGTFTDGTYYWRVRASNPGSNSGWSTTRSFRIDLTDHPSGPYSVDGDILYFGKATNGSFVVQAFTGAGYALIPEGQVTVANSTRAAEWPTNRIPFTLRGLRPGAYYVRAFLDQDGDKSANSWESAGFIREDNNFYDAALLALPPSLIKQKLEVSIADTDNDHIADDWEWQYFGSLTVMGAGTLRGYTDSNGDGILNDFESYAFTPLNVSPVDPNAAGADGVPFRVKAAFGLSPYQDVYFDLSGFSIDALRRPVVRWFTPLTGGAMGGGVSGRGTQSNGGVAVQYQVQYSSDLRQWYDVQAQGVVTYNSVSNQFYYVDPPMTNASRSYRLKVLWP